MSSPIFKNFSFLDFFKKSGSSIIRFLLSPRVLSNFLPHCPELLFFAQRCFPFCLHLAFIEDLSLSENPFVLLYCFLPLSVFLFSISLSWFSLSDAFFSLSFILLPVFFTWPWDQHWLFPYFLLHWFISCTPLIIFKVCVSKKKELCFWTYVASDFCWRSW